MPSEAGNNDWSLNKAAHDEMERQLLDVQAKQADAAKQISGMAESERINIERVLNLLMHEMLSISKRVGKLEELQKANNDATIEIRDAWKTAKGTSKVLLVMAGGAVALVQGTIWAIEKWKLFMGR